MTKELKKGIENLSWEDVIDYNYDGGIANYTFEIAGKSFHVATIEFPDALVLKVLEALKKKEYSRVIELKKAYEGALEDPGIDFEKQDVLNENYLSSLWSAYGKYDDEIDQCFFENYVDLDDVKAEILEQVEDK